MRLNTLLIFWWVLYYISYEAHTLNILGIFPYPGQSHFFAFKRYLEELAIRGHNVTVISYFPREQVLQNYHDIRLVGNTKVSEKILPRQRSYWQLLTTSLLLASTGTESCRAMLGDVKVQSLWKSNAQFDISIVEQFNSDCSLGLAHKLGAPVVGVNSHALLPWHYNRFGISYNPAYVPFPFLESGSTLTFYQRIERTVFNVYFRFVYKFLCQRVDQNTLATYFDDVPPLEDLATEIKLLLSYSNFILSGSNLWPANVIEVGGHHVDTPREIPKDILKFIEESEHGIIYISFGSMLRAASAPEYIVSTIISVVSELPQRVLWKWENVTLPGNPKNIMISSWFPQNDILAHPKTLAFYSHCGALSITEAIYHAVPIVGMPVFGDQAVNAGFVEKSGLGVQVHLSELTKEVLLEKFNIVLDKGFRSRVKLLSRAWHDRQTSPMDSAIFWTEFAARNKNFTIRSPAVNVPFYQFYNIDVLAFIILFLSLSAFIVGNIFIFLYSKNSLYGHDLQTKKNK
ncbi:unnamed protein product [Leptosia nina]|uniref:UDP-glucuronosyltransferase n=1 Tax=Leptosia nina TaxID=320188 RepID=A0AAV1J159_9NEOP